MSIKNLQNEDNNWECPICFNELGTIGISFPYTCIHPACFECFRDSINYSKKQELNPKDITCSLCRSPINEEWKLTKTMVVKECVNINMIKYKLYVIK
jgi:uncharacterized CHY-type Zn-finger protein